VPARVARDQDITGAVVTGDALHTQTETARFLVEEKRAHYVLMVKANQPTLYASCRALPWKQATAKYYDHSRGHGRTETRVVQVLTVSHFAFPRLKQVARITRHRTEAATGKRTRETVYVITDPALVTCEARRPRPGPARALGHREQDPLCAGHPEVVEFPVPSRVREVVDHARRLPGSQPRQLNPLVGRAIRQHRP
jgi:predicted transposase YbfD/YdcC